MSAYRFAILSDMHGNSAATEAVLAGIAFEQPDEVLCLGDLVGYGAHPNDVIDLVRQREIPTVMGNYDDGVGFDRNDCGCAYKSQEERERGQASLIWTRAAVDEDRKAYLRTLAPDLRRDVNSVRIRFVHGSPRRMNEYLFADRDPASLERIAKSADSDVLVFGHTHVSWSRDIASVRFVNTGSVGKPKDGDPRAAWVVLTIGPDGGVEVDTRRVDYDIASMAAAIRMAEGLPDHFARDIEIGGRAE